MTTKKTQTGNINNMNVFNELREVPKEAIKEIKAGRLKGMSDINPMWRIQRMTEVFGACGFGWKYDVKKQWTETYGNETKAYCNIDLFVKINGEWSEPIPGTGGSSAVTMERNGTYVSDECFKMALTDALSVAMKALGVGADVYFAKGKEIIDPSTKYSMNEQLAQNAIPPSQENPNQKKKIDPNDIFQAQGYLKQVTTKEQLKWVADNYAPLLKTDPNFLKMCSDKKKELGLQ